MNEGGTQYGRQLQGADVNISTTRIDEINQGRSGGDGQGGLMKAVRGRQCDGDLVTVCGGLSVSHFDIQKVPICLSERRLRS